MTFILLMKTHMSKKCLMNQFKRLKYLYNKLIQKWGKFKSNLSINSKIASLCHLYNIFANFGWICDPM